MVNKIEVEIRCVGSRDLGQPGHGLGGQLNDRQVKEVCRAVVTEIVAKPVGKFRTIRKSLNFRFK